MRELSGRRLRALEAACSDVRTDLMSRCLYAIDASIYRVEPAAVAFPRSAPEAARLMAAAAEHGLEITPRGGGTGLAGGALGRGVVVDLARYNRRVTDLDLERRTVTVGAGVILDQLNASLAPNGLWFGPDVATSSRATLGGMIANNSSGAYAPFYGTTADHLEQVEVVLTDGTVGRVGVDGCDLVSIRESADRIVAGQREAIEARLPGGLVKRWPGYGLDRALRSPGDLAQLVAGSEGTLAGITSAVLRLVERPALRQLGIVFFASPEEALEAAVEIDDLGPAAVEHIDDVVFNQTRGQLEFRAARDLLCLDEQPCRAMLLVEFFGDDDGRLEELGRRGLGLRQLSIRDTAQQGLVWSLRRAGLSLLTGRKGSAKPVSGVEDVCVRPDRLPEYVRGLREIFEPLGLEASFYGHAGAGELHVRPVLDLHRPDGVCMLRQVADEVSDLCRRFRGSLAAEHGVGIARTEYLAGHLGPELMDASRRIKELFDPPGLMNPGKIIDDGRYRIDGDLRLGDHPDLRLPFAESLQWTGRDESFIANLEQCNGCGGCRKLTPAMCPTFPGSGDEALSTRGRAAIIRAALESRFEAADAVDSVELEQVLDSCLSCKACVRECPSNVDLARLKVELRHARHRRRGVPLVDRVIAAADLGGRIGTAVPSVANALLVWRPLRRALQRVLGIDADAPLPRYARERFDHWFRRRRAASRSGRRVILWDDTWVRYHEPGIGRAAVRVLEDLDFEVVLATGRVCCGRPAASRGLLDSVRRAAEHNLRLLAKTVEPVVFLEPSCWSMFRDEYTQLGIDGASGVAERCHLFEDFVGANLATDTGGLPPGGRGVEVAVHGHCHAKSMADPRSVATVLGSLPGVEARWLDTGCCGMAGAFGMLHAHRELSREVAEPLLSAIRELSESTTIVASGTSCRHQIGHLAGRRALHPAEFLEAHLESR